jgi:hypothetical protein
VTGDNDPVVGLHEHDARCVAVAEDDRLLPVAGEARIQVTRLAMRGPYGRATLERPGTLGLDRDYPTLLGCLLRCSPRPERLRRPRPSRTRRRPRPSSCTRARRQRRRPLGQFGVIEGAFEAVEEALTDSARVSVARMHAQNARLVAARLRVAGRPAHHFRRVGRQPLDMLRILVRMRERVVELGILEASPMVRCGEGKEAGSPPANSMSQWGWDGLQT